MWRLATIFVFALTIPASAQDRAETLADIRQDLTVLFVEMQELRRELSTTGGSGVTLQGTNILDRVNAIEAEVQRLTAETERLTNRVDTVVRDGTNRIGDLEFRLCELEPACDIANLGETPTLGGGALPEVSAPPSTTPQAGGLSDTGGVELAVAEREDFDRAKLAFDEGNYELAAERFQTFTDTYQGGPLSGLAHLLRGESLQKLGRNSSAARAYLQSYSGTPSGPTAPVALLRLGLSLDGLGQSSEACITLGEVTSRFPTSESSIEAQAARVSMGCS
jgi:tol-pal system protein YbgF